MSFRQFGERLGLTPPSAESIEKREREGSITLKSLEEAGKALNMKLVYGFVPMDGSIKRLKWSITQRCSMTSKVDVIMG